MLKFFRTIRKKLIEEDNVRKYLLYAIGEILLVVIGILIALQINNWNESQKALAAEQELLQNLRSDFQVRLSELNELQLGKIEGIEAGNLLMKQIDDGGFTISKSETNRLLIKVMLSYAFNEKFSTLDMLYNSGEINNIRNLKLREALISWPTNVEEMLEEQRALEINGRILLDFLYDHVLIRDMIGVMDFRDYKSVITESKSEGNYEIILNSLRFENMLANRINLLNWLSIDGKVLIEQADLILHLLDQEITDT